MKNLFFILLAIIAIDSAKVDSEKFNRWMLEESFFSNFLPKYSNKEYAKLKSDILNGRTLDTENDDLIPVVIVPSLLGNKIEAKLDKNHSNFWYCDRHADWYTIWLNTDEWYPFIFNCWIEDFTLQYDYDSQNYSNPDGVQTRYGTYGDVDSVQFIDDAHKAPVWNATIDILLTLGYQVGTNLRAAPYDWRFGPTAYETDFANLKNLIEETYSINGNKKVAVTSLSMGGNFFVLFCNIFVTQEWKDTYIHSFTSFSGAFGGSTEALTGLTSTFSLSNESYVQAPFRALQQSFGKF